jgi:hypothetical protein
MKLIRESVEDIQCLYESDSEGKKTLYLSGTFAQAEVPNRNKRIYPMKVLEPEVNRYIMEKVKTNRAVGELSHPSGPNINPDRICMKIMEINKDGNNFVGRAKVTSTPPGQIVQGLVNDGIAFGVSTRALGSVKPVRDGINEVQDDLKLLAVDVVMDPSGPDCWVNGILEGVDYIYDAARGTVAEQVADESRKELNKMTVRQIEENKLKLFERFIHSLQYNSK